MSKKFFWMSDIHLNFLRNAQIIDWARWMGTVAKNVGCQGIIISGDISEGPDTCQHLRLLSQNIKLPIWFVAGNHDVWRIDRTTIQNAFKELRATEPNIMWLGGDAEIVKLSEQTALIGTDGWYDCQAGDWKNSDLWMRDWDFCHDFLPLNNYIAPIIGLCKQFAAKEIAYMSDQINKALLTGAKNIIVVTHIPPFETASRHRGKPGDPAALPYYCAPSMGEMLLSKANKNPDRNFVVYCGHTHDKFELDVSPNLKVCVCAAEYGCPDFCVIDVE